MTEPAFPAPVRAYLRLRFPAPPAERPYVILNMIASADGKATVEAGESALSSATDKLVLQTLRVHADAVLNGAGTARVSGATPRLRDARLRQARAEFGRPNPPLQAILSARGDLPLDAVFFRRDDFTTLIFVGAETAPEQLARLRSTGRSVELLPAGDERLPELLRRLRIDHGVRLLLLEGGPTLNAGFFHQRLVDEFFLTVSPHIVGGRDTITAVAGEPFGAATMPVLELISAIPVPETNEVYLHWRRSIG